MTKTSHTGNICYSGHSRDSLKDKLWLTNWWAILV